MAMTPFRPIILLGAARSGTKILRDTIAMHPSIDKIPYDINYVWRFGNEKIPHDELTPEQATPTIIRHIRQKFLTYHDARYSLLIEKTVGNTMRPCFVDKVFPEALFINLIRDGRDVIESVQRQWIASPDWSYIFRKTLSYPITQAFGYAMSYAMTVIRKSIKPKNYQIGSWGPRYRGIDEDIRSLDLLSVCAIQWCRSIEITLEQLSRLDQSRIMTIHFESFAMDPAKYLSDFSEFAGIDSAPYKMLDLSFINNTNIGKGLRNLNEEQIEQVMPILEPSLQHLGYL